MKISNDLRLLSSGPKGGFGEIELPQMQAGSTIMPGKVNPVIPEMIGQVAMRVMANDYAITMAASSGQLELNAFMPLIAESLLESLELLNNGVTIFREKCIEGIIPNKEKCQENLEKSAVLAAALIHHIGYDQAAYIARKALRVARQKGDLTEFIKGAKAIEMLKNGDKVLIAEGCTHHRQADDIGNVKIPRWIRQRTGKQIEFEFSAGATFTDYIKKYALIVHCGACMLNRTGMLSRIERAKYHNVPIVNYGILIAYVQGLLPRALEPFPLAKMILEEEDLY